MYLIKLPRTPVSHKIIPFFVLLCVILISPLEIYAQSEEKDRSDGMATIYIFRGNPVGFMNKYELFVEDKYIGTLKHGEYIKLQLPAGNHLIWSNSDNYSYIEAEIEANNSYIINAFVHNGKWRGNLRLYPLHNEEDCKRCKKYLKKKLKKLNKLIDKGKLFVLSYQEKSEKQKEFSEKIREALEKYESGDTKWEHAVLDIPLELS